ncbi:phage holin family protein [Bacillus carboniphilus]|uniref:Phage holin family protein n=1 Tax=Bacillus carboniphilus TaxID=86663 RepID=A0ABN0VVD3_9BACI
MKWLIGILINAIIFIALAGYFTEGLHVESFMASVIASFILSILNIIVRPILVILTLPVTFFTLGFFLFVINAITLVLTDSLMGDAFEISSFGFAIIIAIIMSVANLVINKAVIEPMRKK